MTLLLLGYWKLNDRDLHRVLAGWLSCYLAIRSQYLALLGHQRSNRLQHTAFSAVVPRGRRRIRRNWLQLFSSDQYIGGFEK